MDKIIIIDDYGIQKKLDKFLSENKNNIRLNAEMDEVALKSNSSLAEIIKSYEEKHKLKITTKDKIWFYKSSNVLRFEASGEKVKIFFSNSTFNEINVTIDDLENQLKDFPFLRIHSGHLINGNFIFEIPDSTAGYIKLTTGDEIPVEEPYIRLISNHFKNKFYSLKKQHHGKTIANKGCGKNQGNLITGFPYDTWCYECNGTGIFYTNKQCRFL